MNIKLEPHGLVKVLAGNDLVLRVESSDKRVEFALVCDLNEDEVYLEKGKKYHKGTINARDTGVFEYTLLMKNGNDNWLPARDAKGNTLRVTLQVDPAWIANAILYCVFVRFFKGKTKKEVVRNPAVEKLTGISAEELRQKSIDPETSVLPGEGGTFDDVKAHLDTLKELNINALYFNPIHMIGEIYRGYNMLDTLPSYLQPGSPYSIKDFKSIDPELTYDKDTKKHLLSDPASEFRDLVEAAHEREMYIIMDLVFNHTAHDFVLQRIRPEWYLYKQNPTSLEEPYLYPEDVKEGLPWGDPKHSVPPYDHGVWWEDCAQLNWEYKITPGPNEPPPNYSLKEMWEYFLSVPQYWIKNFGVDGFRSDVAYRVPPDFWRKCIDQARELAQVVKTNLSKDVVFIAESYTTDLAELQQAGFTAVYGDFSHKLKRPIELKGYLDYVYNIGDQHFPKGSRWLHFPDSHDFDRAPRKVLGDELGNAEAAARANQSRWVLSATLPGIPLVFNGFEMVEWQPINIWSYGAINWDKDVNLREFIGKVNRIRSQSKALQLGKYTFIPTNQGLTEETQLFAFEREWENERVIVIVNMDVKSTAGPAEVRLPKWYEKKSYQLTDLMTDKTYFRKGAGLTVILKPGQAHIFKVLVT